jgi:hypothetical protein
VTPERSFKSASAYIIAEKISVVKSVEGNNIRIWSSRPVRGRRREQATVDQWIKSKAALGSGQLFGQWIQIDEPDFTTPVA